MTAPRNNSAPTAKQIAENSKPQMIQVVQGLLNGQSVRQISEATGIPPSRINRWVTSSPEFREMLATIEGQMLDAIEVSIVEGVSDVVERLGPKAAQVLEDMLDSEKDSVKLSAASTVLKMGGFGKQATRPTNVVPIEAHIRERAVDASPAAGD